MQVNFSWKVHIGPSLTIILCFKIPAKEWEKNIYQAFKHVLYMYSWQFLKTV